MADEEDKITPQDDGSLNSDEAHTEADGLFDAEDEEMESDYEDLQVEIGQAFEGVRDVEAAYDIDLMQNIYYIWLLWIDFHLYINSPYVPPTYPPKVIKSGELSENENEQVYTIYDYGDHFSTSVGDSLAKGTRATGKMLNTVIKMMRLMIERVKEVDQEVGQGEAGDEMAIRVAFDGHEIAQRMAFKQCVMHDMNILVTNFDPGEWGERQLRTIWIISPTKVIYPVLENLSRPSE